MSNYDEMQTGRNDPGTEALKSATSLGAIQALRDRNINAMGLVKFGFYDFLYSKFIEQDGKSLFGIEFPKLVKMLGEDATTDSDVRQATMVLQKWLYVTIISWLMARAGIVGGSSRKQSMDFAYAYVLRWGVGAFNIFGTTAGPASGS